MNFPSLSMLWMDNIKSMPSNATISHMCGGAYSQNKTIRYSINSLGTKQQQQQNSPDSLPDKIESRKRLVHHYIIKRGTVNEGNLGYAER